MRLSHEYFMNALKDPIFLNRVKIHENDDFKTRSIQVTNKDACTLFWIKIWNEILIPMYKNLEFYRKIKELDLTIPIFALDYPDYDYVNLLGVPPTWTEIYYSSTITNNTDTPFLKPVFTSHIIFIGYIILTLIILFHFILKF
ncbi:Cc50C22.3-like protein [Microplitis demolitor]|nr:Cc50C22.3-like protein [Microplitis demolitor]